MQLKNLKLNLINPDEFFRLSFPLRPKTYNVLKTRFPGFPVLIVNKSKIIIFGLDFFYYLKKRVAIHPVLQLNISDKEALILNFNLKNKIFGLNLYEKLVFLKKIKSLADREELYKRTDLDLPINQELLNRLDIITGKELKKVLIKERITLKSALRISQFEKEDRKSLVGLFEDITFTSSHQVQLLDMVEEIKFKDKSSIGQILDRAGIDKLAVQEKPQKSILSKLFKLRYPKVSEKESQWNSEIRQMNLPSNFKVLHYPFFEKNQVELRITVSDLEKLKFLMGKLN